MVGGFRLSHCRSAADDGKIFVLVKPRYMFVTVKNDRYAASLQPSEKQLGVFERFCSFKLWA